MAKAKTEEQPEEQAEEQEPEEETLSQAEIEERDAQTPITAAPAPETLPIGQATNEAGTLAEDVFNEPSVGETETVDESLAEEEAESEESEG